MSMHPTSHRHMTKIAMFVMVAIISACRGEALSSDEAMLTLASATTKLSAAVESTCRYKRPPQGTEDSALIARATAHDPSLVQPFSELVLKARCEERHGVVLVCNGSGDKALLEDSGCTGAFDRHAWREQGAPGCQYALALAQLCGR